MEKPPKFIRLREGNSYHSRPTCLLIGHVAIPVPVLGVLFGFIVAAEFIYGIVITATVHGSHGYGFMPMLYTVGVAVAIMLLVLVVNIIQWMVEEVKDANRINRPSGEDEYY